VGAVGPRARGAAPRARASAGASPASAGAPARRDTQPTARVRDAVDPTPVPAPRRALVFVGFMGAGKSTAARTAADALGAEGLDTDELLEAELGESISSFFVREGEAAFRAREEELVLRTLGRPDARVVALGGGALGSERVRDALREHLVVALEVAPEEAWRRCADDERPLARDRARFDALHAERASTYRTAADSIIPAEAGEGAVRAALPALDALRAELEREPGLLRLVWAVSASRDYSVFIGRGVLGRGVLFPRGGRRFVVADERVAALHPLAGDWTLPIAAGEGEKTLGRAEAVMREMARAGVARDDVVVAFGGGVVGDLAGFCAAVYQRGVHCVQVPTTVVAQVDSAYGGKTAVDLPEAKNYVGAYHQPAAVLVDPDVLSTLPAEEVAAGYAEVVKTALIAGGELWERVRAGAGPRDEDVILACLRTKLAVVATDERDAGRRQVLNLGHTVGHALEAATGYRRLRHGEAVALGLLCALRLSGQDELRDQVAALLGAQGLPGRVEGVSEDEVVAHVARDKKRRGAAVSFVLVEAPGAVSYGHAVEVAQLRAAVGEVLGG
jgi:shikimate kinase/3-dehydroquinate synthase